MTAPLLHNFPRRITEETRWVVYRLEEVTNSKGERKQTKVPYQAVSAYSKASARKASSTNTQNWRTFKQAVAAYNAGGWDGIGYMFEGSGFVGIDLDHVRDPETGLIEHYAQTIIDRLNTYCEESHSGTGVHLLLEGKLPEGGRKFDNVEVYDSGRFFTMTGRVIGHIVRDVESRQDEINALHAELSTDYSILKKIKKNTRLKALWDGDQSGYESQSQADLALCGGIAWLAHHAHATIDRLFRRSKLYRSKWDELRGTVTYGAMTITKACESSANGYELTKGGKPLTGGNTATQSAEPTTDLLTTAPPTDAGNAECMEAVYSQELRYCHDRRKWLAWDGNRWKIDGDGSAERAALDVVRARRQAAAAISNTEESSKAFRWAISSESEAKRNAMLSTARILKGFATRVELYDRNPMLAGVPNGVVNLADGTHRPADRDDYLTSLLGATYDPNATCIRWLQFLAEVFNNDAELIAFIQRAIGYTLTGDTREQTMFLCFGHGANGKSVFLDVLTHLLGDYAASASFDTFDAGRRSEATNDLAALKGKRLVTVIETEEDRRLAEARVKAVTGQDKISCRFLYGEFFEYTPQFKLWFAMNHKPVIQGTDNGIWRRVQLIPFTQSFQAHPDKTLATKLLAELPGILNWALAGLRDWQANGLGTAQAIIDATDEYRRESDLVSQWLEECTERDIDGQMPTSLAITSYMAWCKHNGYRAPSDRVLGRRLRELGYESRKGTGGKRYYLGLVLLDDLLSGTSGTN